MKKFLLAVTLATVAIMASMTGVKAAPVSAGDISQSTIQNSTIEGLTSIHLRDNTHNCRRHGISCGGYGVFPGGVFIGPGYYNYDGSYTRSCHRVRRYCRDEWGGGNRYRRCVRDRDCTP